MVTGARKEEERRSGHARQGAGNLESGKTGRPADGAVLARGRAAKWRLGAPKIGN